MIKGYLICIIITILLLFYLITKNMDTYENTEDDVIIVVARYNENVDWLKKEPFNKFKHIIYEKGPNLLNCERCHKLKNVGREGHTYLHYIIENYDKLPNIVVFLPGSAMDIKSYHKQMKTLEIMNMLLNSKDDIISRCVDGDLMDSLKDFILAEYGSSNMENLGINNERKLQEAPIRPFGKWFETNFPNIKKVTDIWYNGIFVVTKEQILKNPKELYVSLLKQLDSHSNPEVGHYMERAWASLFCHN